MITMLAVSSVCAVAVLAYATVKRRAATTAEARRQGIEWVRARGV